jgi:predicted extracellular nuclease
MELPVTRLVADGLEITGHGAELPPPVVIGKGGRPVPSPVIDDDGLTLFEPATDAIDFYESLEGMRVQVNDAVVVGPTSSHGEIVVLGDDGADARPRSGRGGVVLQPDNAHPERIIIDDRLVPDPPPVRVGDRLAGPVEGVLHYSFGTYTLLNRSPLELDTAPVMEPAPTTLSADPNHLTVATFNVENLFAGSDEARFAALAETIVQRMRAPTVLALQEIQDDSGPVDDGTVGAEVTLGRLADSVAAAGGPRYDWRQIDPEDNADGGQPGGNIRVVLLFDPSRVSVDDRPADEPAARVAAGPSLRPNPALIAAGGAAFTNSRKPLAVELQVDGRPLFVIVCHLRSKGGDDPLFGRRQPPVRWSEEQRRPQAAAVRALVDELLLADPGARVVVLGDLNDFEFRQPVEVLASEPLVNLTTALSEPQRWTYVYQGNSQVLDHIIVSSGLADGAEVEVVHVNAAFPAGQRASDHDPVIARFKLR